MIRKLLYSFLPLSKIFNSLFEKHLFSNLKMLCLAIFFITYGASGQVSNYTFSQSSGTFNSITGTNAIAANWDDTATANNIPFNFTFTYNNVNYTTCSINSNGYLTFGATTSANNAFGPISSATGYAGAISAFGMDLTGNTSIVYTTTGTAPNRVFIAEWKSARRYNSMANDGNLNFQIRLSESTNLIQVVYGSCTTNGIDLAAQVGLRGASNTDYNNRSITTGTWATSTAGGSNAANCSNNSGRLPSSGLTFNWTPVCSVNSFTSVTPITNVSFSTLSKTTSASSTTAYENFTSDTPTNVAKSQYYALTVKGNTGGDVNGYYTAFIDWNNDGDFDDSGEYFVLGTIRNSSGTDSKVASAYIQVPAGALTGNIKMRIIGRIGSYNVTPCSAGGSIGQIEDYTINILSGCSGTSGTPVSTASAVCPNAPFVISLPSSTLTDGATYMWQTSPDGNAPWTDATPKPTTFFGTEAFNTLPTNTNVYGSAAITAGQLVLTTATNSLSGAFVIQSTPSINVDAFTVNFDYQIPTSGGADGFSLSYAGDIASDAGGGESGQGSGIIIQFDTYDNEGLATGGSRVRIQYAGNTLYNSAIDTPVLRPTSGNTPVVLTVDSKGRLLLKINGQTVVADLALPATYLSTNKSLWKFKLAARTGGSNDIHAIDNLLIRYLDIANTGSTFTTSQTVKTYYRVVATCGGSSTNSGSVMIDMTSATISAMTAPACTGVAFTVTPANGTNGTIPSGTTYSWPIPVVTGGITGGTASTGSPTSITGTLTNSSGTAQTATYTVTPITGTCTGIPFTLTVTVNPLPTPTFTAQPATICANTDVTYTTQAGMTNYVWGFPGTVVTDYTITSGGTNTSNTVTLQYKTATSKTVTVNYTNANGCTAVTATSSSAIVPSPSTVGGTVGGATTVCMGTNSTTLTLTGHTGSIVRWESSLDGFSTAATPIANTTTTLTAANLTATTSYRAIVQSGSCGSLPSAFATVTVSPATVAGTIGGGTTVCTGTNGTTLTLTGHTGSVTGWESSLNNFLTAGTPIANTTTTLTATNLTATTSYRAIVKSGSCGSATTATYATITVSPTTVGGTVGGGATVCTGTNSTTLTLTGHTGSIVRWESSLDGFSTAATPIANTTTTLTAANLTATTSYRAIVQSGNCGSLPSAFATVTVSPATVAGTIGGGTTVCTGINSTTLTLTGYTGSVTGWESSLNNFSTAGTPIANTTTTLTATNLTATTSYRAIVKSGSCGSATTATYATITISPTTVAGTVGGGATVCTGTNSTTLTLTGHTGSIVRWESSLDGFSTAGTPIANTTTTLTAANLTATTSYRAIVQSGSCGSLPSAFATVTVSPATVAGTIGGGTTVCTGTNSTTLTLTGYTGSVTGWESSLNNFSTAGTPIANTTTTLTATNLTATTSYRAIVKSGSCGSATTVTYATITVSPTTVAGTVGGGATVCTGTNSTTLTLTGHTGNIVRWESSLDGFSTAGIPIANTTTSLTATNLTATTSYRAIVQSGSCNSAISNIATVTVSPATVAGTVSGSAAVCSGTNSTTLTLTGHTGNIIGWESSLNNFSTAGTPIANTTATLSAINLNATTSYRAIVQNGSCGALNAVYATVTVNQLPATPTEGTKTPYTCTQAGSVVLNNLPAGSWTLTQSGIANNVITNSGTTYTVTGLIAGNYTFTVSNGTCPSLPSSTVTITDLSTTTWNGTAWSNGTPDATKSAVFSGAYTIAADLEACSCTINTGVNLVVPTGRTLKITNALNVTTGGSLTFEDSSSLVQVNDASVNTGNITYKRISPKIRQADFTYWSTPVNPQTLYNVSPATQYNMYMGFTGDNWLVTDRSNNMIVGKGYIIRGPQTYSNTAKADYQASFVGVPNNGILSGETLQSGKYYLIGNPYPSALKASAFLAGNLFMNGTLYFWTHNTPVVLGGAYQYTTSDYASFNLTGGVGTAPAASGNGGNNNKTPSGYIAAGQSFFASAATDGTIAFNNAMREGGTNNGQFFKPGKESKETTTEGHHIWLNLTNEGGAFKQMLVGYVDGATNNFDKNYDGKSFDGNVYVDFFSVNDQDKYVIQGRALPFSDTDVVPLGYRSSIAGDFTIAIDQADGDLAQQAVYIEDKSTGVIHDLKAGKFTFTTAAGTFTDRLVLRYTNKTLGTGDFENTENGILVSVKNKVIKVNSAKETIKEVTVFDVSGKLLYNKKKVSATELQIANLQAANQVLLVKVTLDNDYTTTKKIIFQ